MMWASNPLGRLRVALYGTMISSLCSCAWRMIVRAAAGGIALLNVLYTVGSEGVWEYVLGDAVSSTDEDNTGDELSRVSADDCCHDVYFWDDDRW